MPTATFRVLATSAALLLLLVAPACAREITALNQERCTLQLTNVLRVLCIMQTDDLSAEDQPWRRQARSAELDQIRSVSDCCDTPCSMEQLLDFCPETNALG